MTAPETTTRSEHIEWCKQRALAYVDAGELHNAFASLNSDLAKHPETQDHAAIELGMMQMLGGMLDDERDMRQWIEGVR